MPRRFPTIAAYASAAGMRYGWIPSDLAVNCCTLVLVVPVRRVTARQWAVLTTRTLGTNSNDLEMEHTAELIVSTFRLVAVQEFNNARESYESWDRSAVVTFTSAHGEVTVVVVV
jgi:hypothetical protein